MKMSESTAEKIKNGEIGVIPTDTIYGIAASAFSRKAVTRTYKALKRNPKKPFIILIGSIENLGLFDIKLDITTKNILKKIWPGKVSVILPVKSKKFEYLHRGIKTLAFRLPKDASLSRILKKTGPLISTSANPEGLKPAETITQAKKYFGDGIDPIRKTDISEKNKTSSKSVGSNLSNGVDFYIDGDKMKSLPSTLIEIKKGKIGVLRKGAGKISLIRV